MEQSIGNYKKAGEWFWTDGTQVKRSKDLVRVVVVPFMTPAAQELCRKEGVSWLDLSGNAHLKGPGVFIHIEGNPNRFTRRGRPSNLFAPKSSRVVRRLLMDPHKWSSHSDLVEATGIPRSRLSNHLACLRHCKFVDAEPEGRSVRYSLAGGDIGELIGDATVAAAAREAHLASCTRIGPEWV